MSQDCSHYKCWSNLKQLQSRHKCRCECLVFFRYLTLNVNSLTIFLNKIAPSLKRKLTIEDVVCANILCLVLCHRHCVLKTARMSVCTFQADVFGRCVTSCCFSASCVNSVAFWDLAKNNCFLKNIFRSQKQALWLKEHSKNM